VGLLMICLGLKNRKLRCEIEHLQSQLEYGAGGTEHGLGLCSLGF
jgi:hypothetical protein